MSPPKQRKLVLVSGYYGFANLGDEAILEELCNELKQCVAAEDIVVLSNTPEETAKSFGVRSVNRWKCMQILPLLPKTRLFISGGGGLFQDVVSNRSTIFYGAQILAAKKLGAQTMIYAQGIGPLQSFIGERMSRRAFQACDWITVRDKKSIQLLSDWGLEGELTADPVWRLEGSDLPSALDEQVNEAKGRGTELVGLSLRSSKHFGQEELPLLARALHSALADTASLVPIALQPQDKVILEQFIRIWQQHRPKGVTTIDTSKISRPSQWITFLGQLSMLVGMRLHATIMALKSGVATVAIAYDPKVAQVAEQFGAPMLNITNYGGAEGGLDIWSETLKAAVHDRNSLAETARTEAQSARNLACQNFNLLAKILGMQSDGN